MHLGALQGSSFSVDLRAGEGETYLAGTQVAQMAGSVNNNQHL